MTTPINPAGGAPVQRTTTTEKPTAPQASSQKFSVPTTDTVQTGAPKLSFGSLRPLINTHLTNETAISTAKETGRQLGNQSLPVVNNRPQVVANLVDSHSESHG
jgi:hypothetical protein